MTIFHMKPAVTWLMHVPLELYSRREREKERKRWLRTTVSKATQMLWSAQRIQQSHRTKKLQKYIWSPDQLPLHWAFSDMLLKLCAFKAARPIQPSGYGEVCSLHTHFTDTNYIQQRTHWEARVHSSHAHTHRHTDISHVITFKTSAAAVRLKGGHQFDTI